MKKFLISVLFVMLCLGINAQVVTNVWYDTRSGSGIDSASWCSQYKTIYYYITEADRPNIDTADLQNTMLSGLVDGGYWTNNMEVFYCFATKNHTAAEYNWVSPGSYTLSDVGAGGVTFDPYEGVTSDGTNYYDLTFSPSDGSYISQNDLTLGYYTRTSSINEFIGITTLDETIRLYPCYNTNLYGRCNQTGSHTSSNSYSEGLFMMTRTGSTATEAFRNGSSLGTDTDASSSPTSQDIYILRNAAGDRSTNEVAFMFVMKGINSTAASAINTIIEAYMDAIDKGVQ